MAGEGATSNVITWNVTNWITITLMGLIGFWIAGLLQKWYSARAQ